MQPSERHVLGLDPNGLSAKALKARCKGVTRGAALQGWQAPGNEFPLDHSWVILLQLLQPVAYPGLTSYPGLPMFFNVARKNWGRPGRICDVMMTFDTTCIWGTVGNLHLLAHAH